MIIALLWAQRPGGFLAGLTIGMNMVSIEKLAALTLDSGELLSEETHGEQCIQVRQQDNLRWMNFGDVPLQSIILLDDPVKLVFPYTEAMMVALLLHESPGNVLNLGFGGGCFERFFWAWRPEVFIDSVESNPAVISLSKRYFNIPANYMIHNVSAEVYLKETATKYSIILCDIFDAEGHPPCMTDKDFFAGVCEQLEDEGVAVFNSIVTSEQEIIDILLPLRISFPWVYLLNLPMLNNVLLFASKYKPPANEVLACRSEDLLNSMALDLRQISEHLILLPESQVC